MIIKKHYIYTLSILTICLLYGSIHLSAFFSPAPSASSIDLTSKQNSADKISRRIPTNISPAINQRQSEQPLPRKNAVVSQSPHNPLGDDPANQPIIEPGLTLTENRPNYSRADCIDKTSEIAQSFRNYFLMEQGHWLKSKESQYSIDYHSYTIDQLESLAENNDRIAQHILGDKLSDIDPESAKHWYKQAAINGYVVSLRSISNIVKDQYYKTKSNKANDGIEQTTTLDKPSPEPYKIELLAWLNVAMKRKGHKSYLQSFNLDEQPYSEDEIQSAATLADKIYKEILSERMQRGLGEFENKLAKLRRKFQAVRNNCTYASGHATLEK